MPSYNASAAGLLSGLRSTPKSIPCNFLYDVRGSELYEAITQLEEYYPFVTEENMLTQHAAEVISHVPAGSIVVELGCGTARKTGLLLRALLERDGEARFAGVDVSASFLEEAKVNLLQFCPGLKASQVELVQAEYISGLTEVRRRHPSANLCVLWLGSSVGNLPQAAAVQFFKDLYKAAGPNSQVFLCTDMWKDAGTLYRAYCDGQGVTEAFIKNGVRNALLSLGHEAGALDAAMGGWRYEVEINKTTRSVEMWVRFSKGLEVLGGKNGEAVRIEAGERVLVEVSRKFTRGDIAQLAGEAGFYIQAAWRSHLYGMQWLLPAQQALLRSWADTDAFYAKQVPDWLAQPIEMRHPFCFYYGHVAGFTRLKALPQIPPTPTDTMFSRGIDPSVLDPSKCHSHPEVPPEWPTKEQVTSYVEHTRQMVLKAVQKGGVSMRAICMGLEHERMHQETLAYMLVQEKKRQFEADPPGEESLPRPVEVKKPKEAARQVVIPPGKVTLGVDEADAGAFVWDNEGPAVRTSVSQAFAVASGPVTVADFHKFVVQDKGYQQEALWESADLAFLRAKGLSHPATWSPLSGEYYVHLPEGTFHWTAVADRPVWVSLSEAKAYCSLRGGRIMTEAEYQRTLDHCDAGGAEVEELRTGGYEWTSTPFGPFPGFKAMEEYPEYSTDFFDGCHFVLRGSSPVTHPAMRRDSFRNFYQQQYPFMFAKFRLCSTVEEVPAV